MFDFLFVHTLFTIPLRYILCTKYWWFNVNTADVLCKLMVLYNYENIVE